MSTTPPDPAAVATMPVMSSGDQPARQARNVCVLFADVAGSTRLYERLGDKLALAAIGSCIEGMSGVTRMYRGRVVKTIGDEVMAVFDAAEDGMQAACEMQQRILAMPPSEGVRLAIRVGFHFGPALLEHNDVFGDTVNVAARMAGLARGGQIMTSGETVNALPPLLRQATRDLDALTVKGKAEDIRVFEVIWQESDELTLLSTGLAPAAPLALRLRLVHGGREFILDRDNQQLTMGRDTGNTLVVADQRASRQHARIERRRDKFLIVDQSTNGTHVVFSGEPEIVLKREEAILRGSGCITFGHSLRNDGSDVVEFEILA